VVVVDSVIIDDQYVDSVNIDELVDKAIPEILSELDPHSVYISAKDVQLATDDLKGSFSGVGIEFNIRQDTLCIQNVIKDGPADKAGLLAGDKVVSINGKSFVGKDVTNEEAMHRLKGPKDSKVKIGVKRYGEKGVKMFTVTRGDIAVKSVSAAYMLNDTTGYIRIKSFGERTYAEMLAALQTLNIRGADHLVIDLRDNGGGILESAVQMANEFLPKNRLIVHKVERVLVLIIVVMVREVISIFLWLYLSMKVRLLLQRSSLVLCKITIVQRLLVVVPLVRDWYNSKFSLMTVV